MRYTENELMAVVNSYGGKLYLVGGAVRDLLLFKEPNDKDYVITGIEDCTVLPFDKIVGSDFPVFLVNIDGEECEVAFARKERSTGLGHKDFSIETNASITIIDDLSRRDLTVNSIALDLVTGKYIDPFFGQIDLQNKILRHTSEAFKEDPLRVFRLARFMCRFDDFKVNQSTIDICKIMKEQLNSLSSERVFKELYKALGSINPRRFFDFLLEVKCLDNIFFKVIFDLCVPDMHDGTVYNHTMKLLNKTDDIKIRFGLLCHDLGKGRTNPVEHPHHFRHDKLGAQAVRDFCLAIKAPNELRDFGVKCSETHMKIKRMSEMRKGKLYMFINKYLSDFEDLLNVSFIDSYFRDTKTEIEPEQIESNSFLYNAVLKVNKTITGKMLIAEGHEPGVKLGETLLNKRIHCFMKILKETK